MRSSKKRSSKKSSMSLTEKKRIYELVDIVSVLNEKQMKNFSKIVDNPTIQRLCCVVYSMCLKDRGNHIKKSLRKIFLECLCGKKNIWLENKIVSVEKEAY